MCLLFGYNIILHVTILVPLPCMEEGLFANRIKDKNAESARLLTLSRTSSELMYYQVKWINKVLQSNLLNMLDLLTHLDFCKKSC